jgi:hypothetical protein
LRQSKVLNSDPAFDLLEVHTPIIEFECILGNHRFRTAPILLGLDILQRRLSTFSHFVEVLQHIFVNQFPYAIAAHEWYQLRRIAMGLFRTGLLKVDCFPLLQTFEIVEARRRR